jgi:hypothetical protein
MKCTDYKKAVEASLSRLHSISKKAGIPDKPRQSPVVTTELKALADYLILCPDDNAAERALRRYPAAWPGFLFFPNKKTGTSWAAFCLRKIPIKMFAPIFILPLLSPTVLIGWKKHDT